MSKSVIEEYNIQIGNRNISYLTCGEGPVIILIHGGLGNSRLHWEKHLMILAKRFKVYAPDTRGHGNSTNPENIWSYKQFAKDLQEFVVKLELDNPYICGYSDGGIIALEHAIQFPDVVPKYIVGGANREMTQEIIEGFDVFGFSSTGVVDYNKFGLYFHDHVDTLKQMHKHREPDYWKTLVEGTANLWTTPFELSDSQLSKITAEIMIITGDRDEFVPFEQSISLYRSISKSRLAVSQNTGHMLPTDRMNWFINELIDFFIE